MTIKRPSCRYIVGIDEVGRGPLAGPVTVSAVLIRSNAKIPVKICDERVGGRCFPIRDSKKLNQIEREAWSDWVLKSEKQNRLFSFTAQVSPRVIDKINISKAANVAAGRAIDGVIKKSGINAKGSISVFTDYGIAPVFIGSVLPVFSFIKGDEKIPVISLASIIAKVRRDGYMRRLSKKYPDYGFEMHKGYGTKRHIMAIKKFGPSPMHRLTFIGNFRKMG